ncbi:ACP S-malonyltransferase [Thiospirochaeta perfilievii]|uniref:Malonyl CoA-acyl carrier protein transacylase n=1 Tax=Thiospirochaeta perfilievii TaxID=252967 RepID=A0A5C1QAE3_9SPIO|nr:ACP S-malonyltransferase [Thiospirochaeta perfilievii]QEN03766.1 ACP S-malonyltransferase [Thiospirochaeta perfilievii]
MNVFLYPGQGAQYPLMGTDFYENSDAVKELFDIAQKETGIDVKELLFNGSPEDLKQTDNTQVAITLVNLASTIMLKEKGIDPSGVAGFSLGEYAALATAGVVSVKDVFKLVKKRGDVMQSVCEGLKESKGETGMSAVLRITPEVIEDVIKTSGIDGVYMANYNSPSQTVISGLKESLLAIEPLLKEAGARRVVHLQVSGPFHSPLLEEAKNQFEDFLSTITFNDPQMPIYSNVTGDIIKSGEEAKKLCGDQIICPVKWISIENKIKEAGFTTAYESGPGKVLTGLFAGIDKEFKSIPSGTLEDIQGIQE